MSDSEQMASLLKALERQAKDTRALIKAVSALAESNMALADAVMAGEPDQEEDGHGTDMAGNPIRVS